MSTHQSNTPQSGASPDVLDISLSAEPPTFADARTLASAEEFLLGHDPAVEGQGGRPKTRQAVWKLIHGMQLPTDVATDLLCRLYNPRCVPPWSRGDLEDMCASAFSARFKGPQSSPGPGQEPNADTLDTAYRIILSGLPLHESDRQALLLRGLSAAEVEALGYRSWTTSIDRRTAILQQVSSALGDEMYAVPGIYRTDGGAELGLPIAGLAVAVRDAQGRIVGIRVRVVREKRSKNGKPLKDSKGRRAIQKDYLWLSGRKGAPGDAKAKAQVHVPIHSSTVDLSTLGITEGEIKADIATLRTGHVYISVPGVGNWSLALDVARALGSKRVLLAFDADSDRNPDVAGALIRTAEAASRLGMVVAAQTWSAEDGR